MSKMLDEHAFNDAFKENSHYRDLDHHFLYNFVCYYESAKQHRNKHTVTSGAVMGMIQIPDNPTRD